MKEMKIRSLLKAISWRVLATATTFIITYFITGSFNYATSISLIEVVSKIALFYFHERLWCVIKLSKVPNNQTLNLSA